MSDSRFIKLIHSFNQLDGLADILLLDTGAGISRDVSNFLLAADEVVVVTTPEPHALTDAYAIIKIMHKLQCSSRKMLIVNRAETVEEAREVADKLITVSHHFLHQEIKYLGSVCEDRVVRKSLKAQYPLILSHPQSAVAKDVRAIAANLLHLPVNPVNTEANRGITGFVSKLVSLFRRNSSEKILQPY